MKAKVISPEEAAKQAKIEEAKELEEKAAIIAQTEDANSAVFDEPAKKPAAKPVTAAKKVDTKKPSEKKAEAPKKPEAVISPEQQQKNEQKFLADKQSALQDGYSEDQALQYAQQEQSLAE